MQKNSILFTLFLVLFYTSLWGASIDDQIAQANKSADSLVVVAHALGSQKSAARLDSLFQADPTLKAARVRAVGGGKDSIWVKLALDNLSAGDKRLVKGELAGADCDFTLIGSDTLYVRRDLVERALPLISAVLKE